MVKCLHIKDFQSHMDTEIHFSPSVNVVMGRNMTGKSSVLRALRLVFYNKPEGREFVTWGAKNAVVEVDYGDHVFRRIKGAQNVYEVDGSVFTGFGRQIPEEVVNALGFTSIQVDRKVYELNYNHPHEAPFFISETDAVKGKLFTRLGERVLSDLVLLDKSIQSANATLRKLSSEQQVLSTQEETTEESLSVFAPLPEMVISFDHCKQSLTEADSLNYTLVQLRSVRGESQEIREAKDFFTELLSIDISPVVNALQEATLLQQDIKYAIQVAEAHTECTRATQRVSSTIQILQDLPTDQLAQAQQLQTQLDELYRLRTSLQTNERNIAVIQKQRRRRQTELGDTLTKYKTLLTRAQKCPLCFRPVGEHDLDIILKELVGDDPGTVTTEG